MGDLLWGEIPKRRIDAPKEVPKDEHKHWFYQFKESGELITCECFPPDLRQEILDAIKRGRSKRNDRG